MKSSFLYQPSPTDVQLIQVLIQLIATAMAMAMLTPPPFSPSRSPLLHLHRSFFASFASSSAFSSSRTSPPSRATPLGPTDCPPYAQEERLPLSLAVSHCVRRWFKDTLKAALAGDTSMQILVAQMYHSGYGVTRNQIQAKKWMKEASKYRSSAWKDSAKRPGYNGSDSDSDKPEGNGKQ